jgi:hypothetical protein
MFNISADIKVNDSVYTLACECECITSLFSSKKRDSLSLVRKWLIPYMVDLLIIVCLTSRRKHFMHIREENKLNNIKLYRREGRMGNPEQRLLTAA